MATHAQARHAYTDTISGIWACIRFSDRKDPEKSKNIADAYHRLGAKEVRVYRARKINGSLEFPPWHGDYVTVGYEGPLKAIFEQLFQDSKRSEEADKKTHEANGLSSLIR